MERAKKVRNGYHENYLLIFKQKRCDITLPSRPPSVAGDKSNSFGRLPMINTTQIDAKGAADRAVGRVLALHQKHVSAIPTTLIERGN
jgi:hypothetical protein